ncbi:class I SAM-dependent methyltransferase [Clostridium sp. MB40-C1]|uniref:class I SAM-dependent methyltransferase n=1 Tax=Clostridium sp. MB40-C1 TaxID=3070996 RepID=UPI0027E1ED4C|nr:class I SAM-dependent methyltransferase [Clostridium sp. MB40-C1]WMJ81732.1 class I SAM-dependent methyltransferase [Clostridium sp. MB40-C1]
MVGEKVKSINIWNKVAHNFSKGGPDFWNEFGKRLVELSSIKEGAKILDVAMGRGASLFPAIKKIGKNGYAIGIDISGNMVNETYNDIVKQSINNAEVRKMNALNLKFNDNFFDNVICGFGIGYILPSDIKLTEIIRVLKKNGQVGFSIWGVQEQKKWLVDITNKYINMNSSNKNSDEKSNIIEFNTVRDVKKILEESGLKNVKVYQEESDIIYKSKEEWWTEMNSNEVRMAFDEIEKLGSDKLKEYKKEIFNILEIYKKEDGFHLNMPVIYAFGEKFF